MVYMNDGAWATLLYYRYEVCVRVINIDIINEVFASRKNMRQPRNLLFLCGYVYLIIVGKSLNYIKQLLLMIK